MFYFISIYTATRLHRYLVKRQKKRMMQQLAANNDHEELLSARAGPLPSKQRSYSNATSNSGTGASSDYSSERSGSYDDEEDELI
jgi:hypothetical protein